MAQMTWKKPWNTVKLSKKGVFSVCYTLLCTACNDRNRNLHLQEELFQAWNITATGERQFSAEQYFILDGKSRVSHLQTQNSGMQPVCESLTDKDFLSVLISGYVFVKMPLELIA